MSEIKRYQPCIYVSREGAESMALMDDLDIGDYVTYQDHCKVVEAMQEKIDSLTSMLRNMWA